MQEKEKKARLRAEVILKVRSGLITAKEGARILGVSRKTYYQWEKRGLSGLMDALIEKDPGRTPRETDAEKERLRKENESLEEEAKRLRASLRVKEVMEEDEECPSGTRIEKKERDEEKR